MSACQVLAAKGAAHKIIFCQEICTPNSSAHRICEPNGLMEITGIPQNPLCGSRKRTPTPGHFLRFLGLQKPSENLQKTANNLKTSQTPSIPIPTPASD